MFDFLFGKKGKEISEEDLINKVYSKLRLKYSEDEISQERKDELSKLVKDNGYLPYSYQKALNELSNAEILYLLKFKWINNKVFSENIFKFDNDKISVLSRNNVTNSDWIKREGHDIKLINLAALGDGNKSSDTGKFMDWLRQLVILPSGNLENNIYSTTIYLVPFNPREFGCAYLPKSSEISEALYDENIFNETGLDAKGQVKMFITMSQLAGHPVIYDILPQTGRFSKAVIANPNIARWFDINNLEEMISVEIDNFATKLNEKYDSEDVDVVKDIYKQNRTAADLSEHYQKIYEDFENGLEEIKIKLSNNMLNCENQIKISKQVNEIVHTMLNIKQNKKLTEDDITNQPEIIAKLIKQNLWPAPGGAWCSAGVPVYDGMSDCGDYPTFKHYDYKGNDVTNFANLDCQTPYYFAFLDKGTLNMPVVDYFLNYLQNIQAEYNFDGFRVDHIDHIVDKVSEKDGIPISYRAPRTVLKMLNEKMKSKIHYFATLAEYMLWDDYLKEYHKDMNFDLLWGNDIVSQIEKDPEKIVEDNQNLANYNVDFKEGEKLSILKTYNNQDGEFRCIDQYPGQLGEMGALFKWFKYKFLPGGKFAERPVFYVDGDETFTQKGIERVIGEEVSMERADNDEFYNKFNAIDKFVKNDEIIIGGEAQIIKQDCDGFVAWLISKEPLKKSYLIVANYHYPSEKKISTDENGTQYAKIVNGEAVNNKNIKLPGDYIFEAEYTLLNNDFVLDKFENEVSELNFKEIKPSEFKLYQLKQK